MCRETRHLTSAGFQTDAREDELIEKFPTPYKSRMMRILFLASAVIAVIVSLPSFDVSNIAAQAGPRISKIEPDVAIVTARGGEKVLLTVDVYGLEGDKDNALAADASFVWSTTKASSAPASVTSESRFSETDASADADTDADERAVLYTAPSAPGSNMIYVSLDRKECTNGGCGTVIMVIVRRPPSQPPEDLPPVNPSVPIPSLITDASGRIYSTFTPVEGGEFIGEGFSIRAGAGAVHSGEFIGISISEGADADNTGSTSHRYTLGGSKYDISVINSSGEAVGSYSLSAAAEVCVPMPDMFRPKISDVSLLSVNDSGTLTILQSRIKIIGVGIDLCGAVRFLPATVAVGVAGSPPDFPTPVPTTAPDTPNTGGWSPSPGAAVLALLLGMAVAMIGATVLLGRRRESKSRR